MKACPQCAEQVQDDAKVCRYCRHRFSSGADKVAKAITTGVLVLGLGWCVTQMNTGSTRSGSAAAPLSTGMSYSADRVAQCHKLLSEGSAAGLIRAQPSWNRVEVDEAMWTAMPAASKKGLALAIPCAGVGRATIMADPTPVVYGYHSGKRLALVSPVGVSLE